MLLPLGQTESDLICYVLKWVDSNSAGLWGKSRYRVYYWYIIALSRRLWGDRVGLFPIIPSPLPTTRMRVIAYNGWFMLLPLGRTIYTELFIYNTEGSEESGFRLLPISSLLPLPTPNSQEWLNRVGDSCYFPLIVPTIPTLYQTLPRKENHDGLLRRKVRRKPWYNMRYAINLCTKTELRYQRSIHETEVAILNFALYLHKEAATHLLLSTYSSHQENHDRVVKKTTILLTKKWILLPPLPHGGVCSIAATIAHRRDLERGSARKECLWPTYPHDSVVKKKKNNMILP